MRNVGADVSWVGTAWKFHGGGRVLVGKVRSVDGSAVVLAVTGLGMAAAASMALVGYEVDGTPLVRVGLSVLLSAWKPLETTA